MRTDAQLPTRIGGIAVPRDDVSAATWRWACRSLPDYLLTHSVRSYCWGATIAAREGWDFDRRLLWTAALFHDVGLTRLPRNSTCFEMEGGEIARRFLERAGMPAGEADRAARAIVLHMAPDVTLEDGVELVLLDRATGLDVRGAGFDLVEAVRPAVVARSRAARSTGTSCRRCRARRRAGRRARAPVWSTRSDWLAGWRRRRGAGQDDGGTRGSGVGSG